MTPPASQDTPGAAPEGGHPDAIAPGAVRRDAHLAEQVRLLFVNSFFGQFINLGISTLLAAGLWPFASRLTVGLWLAAMYAVITLRFVLHYRHDRQPAAITPHRWLAWFRAAAAATGAIWGASWLMLPAGSPLALEMLIAVVMAGMIGAAVPYLGAVFAVYRDYTLLAVLPTAAHFFLDGDRLHLLFGAMSLLYLAGALGSARRFQGTLLDSLRLRESQTELVRSLTDANAELRAMRDNLERRVAERTEALRGQLAERERAEAALRANEEIFRLITDNVSDMIAVWDRNGRQLYGSRSLTRALGRANVTGSRPAYGEVHPQDMERLRAILRHTFDTGTPCHAELRLSDEEGMRFIDCAVEPVRGPQDDTDRVVVVARDVTRRRHEESIVRGAKERLTLAIEATGQMLFDVDCTHQRVYLDANWAQWLGGPTVETLATFDELLPLVPPEERATLRVSYLRALKGEISHYEVQHRVQVRSGEYRWIASRAKVVERDAAGRAVRMLGTNRDITLQREADQRLRLVSRALDDMAEGVVILDAQWRILSVNPAFTRITGYAPEESVGRVSALRRIGTGGPDDLPDIALGVRERGHWEGRVMDRRKSGAPYPAWVSASAMREPDGGMSSIVIVFTDISRQERDAERVRFLAYHDSLTGLPNRSLFFQRAGDMIRRAGRQRRRMALLFVDLDHFKAVNDSLGHEAGDQLLVEIAARLRNGLREFDVVARLGGDEFAVMLDDVEGDSSAGAVAAKLIEALSQPVHLGGQHLLVSASIGISRFPNDGVTAELLLRQADAAMYLAKQDGRNRYRFFSPEITAGVMRRLDLATGLRLALDRNELELHYQPAIDATDGRVLGAEALLRWRHPERGMIGPTEFIHVAEETGMIDVIGRWVLETACRQLREWQAAGLTDLSMKVNLSPLQFRQPALLQQVREAMEVNQLAPGTLELEITETAAMQDPDRTERVLAQMRDLGIRVSLDDFGTGHSSLAQLSRFPIQGLKIDRTLVAALPGDHKNAVIAGAVVALCRSLGLDLVGEGVEQVDQAEFLLAQGCRQMQGFLFSRPVPADEMTALLGRGDYAGWTFGAGATAH